MFSFVVLFGGVDTPFGAPLAGIEPDDFGKEGVVSQMSLRPKNHESGETDPGGRGCSLACTRIRVVIGDDVLRGIDQLYDLIGHRVVLVITGQDPISILLDILDVAPVLVYNGGEFDLAEGFSTWSTVMLLRTHSSTA
jgi:hypothetical protein